MYVKKINSKRYNKTFYKVFLENNEEVERFKNSLVFYKDEYTRIANELSTDEEEKQAYIDFYNAFGEGLSKLEKSENGEQSFILYEVGSILDQLLYLLVSWYTNERLIKKLDVLSENQKQTIDLQKEQIGIQKEQIGIQKEHIEIQKENIESLKETIELLNENIKIKNDMFLKVHEDPSILQRVSWTELKKIFS